MNSEGNVLLGALLDRMGKTQAQALLARLEQWLREREPNRISHLDSKTASWTPKDTQS
jgi:hypothetical protein